MKMKQKKIALKDALAYLLTRGNKILTEKSKTIEYRQIVIEMMFILIAVYEMHNTDDEIITVNFPSEEADE